MERMRVLLIEPLEKPRLVEIDHDLDTMQALVGGPISCTYPWEDLVGLVHCDTGHDQGLPMNRMLKDENGEIYNIVPGVFFICGLTEDSFCSLPDELAEKFTELFRYPEMYMRTMDGHVVCFRLGSNEAPIQII
ncbi:MAG: DUF3846 domain-containing protein [Clostridia bacterium]|nr:DUF3846 domain-containing protein [Clostridia bacterium]